MKILAIRGKNLASLAGEFEVNFEQEPLKSTGLFAISGPTGAGKSTLLDALCMALYEDTPRLNKASHAKTLPDGEELITHQNAANLLRRNTGDGYAEVDFVGTDDVQYRSRWSVRRSRDKANGVLQPTTMLLQQLPDLRPIGGTKQETKAAIIERIGLTFGQFTRAVLLAQNEFSSFLKADDSERGELLETLTGSTIYSQLSKRAHDRAKLERDALARINERLADHKPLADEERAQLEQDSATSQTQLAEIDAQLTQIQALQRWQQSAHHLAQSEQQAQTQLTEQVLHDAASASRRTHLQQLENVQSARPLLAECDRLQTSLSHHHASVAEQQTTLTLTEQRGEQAQVALLQSQSTLQQAEQAQTQAAAQLDAAKALDASIHTLLPAHQQTQQHQAHAAEQLAQTTQALQAKYSARQLADAKQQAAQDWLQQHSALQNLANSWPAWELLLKQAASSSQAQQQHAAQCAHSGKILTQQQQEVEKLSSAVTEAAEQSNRADNAKQQATIAYDAIASADLPTRQQHAEQRRNALHSATTLQQKVDELQSRVSDLQQKLAHSQQAQLTASAAAQQAQTQLPALAAAMAQAERALKQAEAACAANVEDLRALLTDETPCPVCGSNEHPYRGNGEQKGAHTITNATLHALLATLQAEVYACRAQHQTQQQQAASQQALAAQHQKHADNVGQEAQHAQAQLLGAQTEWQAHPIAVDYALEYAELKITESIALWLSEQSKVQQAELDQLAILNTQYQRALQAKNAAQTDFGQRLAFHHAQKEALNLAQQALAKTQAQHASASEKMQQAQQQRDAHLQALAPAFQHNEHVSDAAEWQATWQNDTAQFQQDCSANVKRWQQKTQERDQLIHSIATLELEAQALVTAQQKADADHQRSEQAQQASALTLQDKRHQRAALFDGNSVQHVEANLADAIHAAKQHHTQQSSLCDQLKQTHSRATEALAQAQQRLQQDSISSTQSISDLDQWLTDYRPEHRSTSDQERGNDDSAEEFNVARLRTLLATNATWFNSERAALQALSNATQQARTVLAERQQQTQTHHDSYAQHQALADELINTLINSVIATQATSETQHDESAPDLNALALYAQQHLTEQRKITHNQLTEKQLTLAQDQARRSKAADLLGTLQAQENTASIWAKLSDLIGAADGKKFRNYAQQFTLDVLLGYANRHLAELARRYRLQRIPDTLALMVIDQDMGDEARSVHSLSGGESFLVSLALALGLASLSSNRVRVESLFIDEGFGSLDADTLGVAMDALDGLQAMGRKVGVISHVQEMTERIAVKVIVQRGVGGRSFVGVG